MIKRFNTIIFIILTIFLIVLFPQKGNAKEKLIVSEWVVNASVLENGDLSISEDITFKFNDDFNGVIREVVIKDGIKDVQVSEINEDLINEYNRVNKAKNGDDGVFVFKEEKESVNIEIFSPSENEKKTFRISYNVKNVAIKYNDIGEVYYKLVGDENNIPIDKFKANITLPSEDNEDLTKLFVHGPQNGKFNQVNEKLYTLEVEDVKANTLIEFRIVFPKEFIYLSENIENKDNYENILAEEERYKNKLKQKEINSRILGVTSLVLSQIGLGAFVISVIWLRRKNIYINESSGIPEDSTPAVVAILTQGIIRGNVIGATILDLVRKQYLKIKESDNDNYLITQYKEIDNSLIYHEQYFCDFLINKIGNGVSVSTKDIEKFSKEKRNEFIEFHTTWRTKVKEDAVNKGYYDKSKTKLGLFFLIYSIVLFIISIITVSLENILGLPAVVVSIVMFIYSIILFFRLSDYGYQRYKEWLNFKIYMNKKEISFSKENIINYEPDISLIYALALGATKKITLNIENIDNVIYSNNWFFWYLIFISNGTFTNSINNSLAHNSSTYGSFTSGGGGGVGGGGVSGF